MIILNGRKPGDLFGKYTSLNWNGRAVVDFGVAPVDWFDAIVSFTVGNYAPFISDHCPIFFELKSTRKKVSEVDANLKESPVVFKISDEDLVKLKETIQSPEIADKLIDMSNTTNEPQALASGITNTLLEACSLAELRPKKIKFNTTDKPWFDKECQTLKNGIKKKCKKLRANKSDFSLQQQISAKNKDLKNLVLKKKNEYKLKIVDEMNLTGKN